MYDSGDYTVQQIADEFGVTHPTVYRHLSKVASEPAETG
ncbi:helix-turn-helix domain-containing protein [Streptomyces lavendulocolor]